MNILFLTENNIEKVVGGVERVTRILSEEFRKAGHNVVCVSSTDGEEGNPLSQEQFLKLLVNNQINIVINQNLIEHHFKLLSQVPRGIKVFSVLHNRPFQHEGLGKLFKKISYPKTTRGNLMKFIGVNFPDFYIYQRRRATKKNISRFLEVSDQLIVLCEDYKKRIQRFMPEVESSGIDFIPNPNTFEPNHISSEKKNLLLFVGRLENPQKNVTDFIDIWKSFHKDNPGWKARIIGDGPHRKKIEEYACKEGVSDLEFVGSVDNVEEYYSRAKLLCMTSLYEGWPMTLPEAISFDCLPVLYDSFESAQIIIGKENNDCLVAPFKKENLAKRLSYFANNENIRRSILSQIKTNLGQFSATCVSRLWLKKVF